MFMDKLGGGQMLGNVLALLSGLTFSFYFVFMRMQKDASPLESILLSHWLTARRSASRRRCSCPRRTFHPESRRGDRRPGDAFRSGVAAILFAAAIKRISAVSANLIAVIEPVFNPLWVFLALGEAPGARSLVGGAVIIVAVTAASIISARRSSARIRVIS